MLLKVNQSTKKIGKSKMNDSIWLTTKYLPCCRSMQISGGKGKKNFGIHLRQLGVWGCWIKQTPWPCLKLRCARGREFEPRPGQYSRMSFSSDQVTAQFSLIWKCLSFQILNLFRTLSSWGSGNYRASAPLLYEVASHVKQLPFRPLLLLL